MLAVVVDVPVFVDTVELEDKGKQIGISQVLKTVKCVKNDFRIVLEVSDVVLAVVVDVPVVVDIVELEEKVKLVLVLELKVKLVVDDSVDVVSLSQISSHSS
jgi:PII-like signaling protein